MDKVRVGVGDDGKVHAITVTDTAYCKVKIIQPMTVSINTDAILCADCRYEYERGLRIGVGSKSATRK